MLMIVFMFFFCLSGMDLFACDSMLNFRLVETRKVNVNWYIYTHETRLALLASGMKTKTVTRFQALHQIYRQAK